jgi:hypothetical protein
MYDRRPDVALLQDNANMISVESLYPMPSIHPQRSSRAEANRHSTRALYHLAREGKGTAC